MKHLSGRKLSTSRTDEISQEFGTMVVNGNDYDGGSAGTMVKNDTVKRKQPFHFILPLVGFTVFLYLFV